MFLLALEKRSQIVSLVGLLAVVILLKVGSVCGFISVSGCKLFFVVPRFFRRRIICCGVFIIEILPFYILACQYVIHGGILEYVKQGCSVEIFSHSGAGG